MNNHVQHNNEITPDTADVIIKEKHTPWLIWLLPAITLMIGGWLIYKSYVDAGTEILIHLPNGRGIVANQTEVKFEGVRFGLVKEVQLADNLRGVNAVIEIDKRAAAVLQEDTVFWVVEPQISLSRISGLDTLVSGSYITFQIGEKLGNMPEKDILKLKPTTREYTALIKPPSKPTYLGGLHLVVTSTRPASITSGASVNYQKVKVGEIEKVSLSQDGKTVYYDVYIEESYRHLINARTRFWDVSGITVQGSLKNVEIKMDSLNTLLIGGIAFGNPSSSEGLAPLKDNNHKFVLFPDNDEAFSKKHLISIEFKSADGLSAGTPIKYNGLQVGEVETIELKKNLKGVVATVNLFEHANHIARLDSKFWIIKPQLGLTGSRNLDTLLEGQYITVEPGKGKTANRFVGLDSPPNLKSNVSGQDLKIILIAKQLGSVKQGVKIYYRNVAVGQVDGFELEKDGSQVRIYASIAYKYAPLVRTNTRFWNASGINVGYKLFSGLDIKTQSMDTLLEGGIAFATPNNPEMGDAVVAEASFGLADEIDSAWEQWQPNIPLNTNAISN
ncbi:MAG: MCE family protein [Gammaproteobacteria bacterium]|nr:MCE family protein [Gammaproteobacteria bacterium]